MYKFCTRPLRHIVPSLACLLALLPLPLAAQDAPVSDRMVQSRVSATVPPLIQFSGVATDAGGSSLSGRVTLTFSLYSSPQGGDPLWTEKQDVDLDATGHYSVQLGITRNGGIPAALFASGHPRWLGIQIGEEPQNGRVLLVSVPYALKAADAQTLGGLPPAAFLRAPEFEGGATISTTSTTHGVKSNSLPPLAGSGAAGQIPFFTPDGDTLGSSIMFQSGSGGSAKIGIGNVNPGAKLDVSGGATIRGTFKLASQGTASASAGSPSQPINMVASTLSAGTASAVNQTFAWQAVPVANNSANPSAGLHLEFASGTATPADTGLVFTSTGALNINKTGVGLLVVNPDTTSVGSAAISAQATGFGSAVNTIGVSASATGDQGVGVLATATGGLGVGVEAQTFGLSGAAILASAEGDNGRGIVASANGQQGIAILGESGQTAGIGVEGFSTNGLGGEFITSSTTHPALHALNRGTGSIFQAATGQGAAKVFDLGPAGFTLLTNGATTTVGNVGCATGFAGISFGLVGNCSDYSLVGDATNTTINRKAGGRIDFRENNVAEMSLVSGGRVGIGVGSPAAQLDVMAPAGAAHAPVSQFGSTGTTDSNSLRTYNGSGVVEIFAVGKVANFVPGSAVGDGGLRVNPGKNILFGDSGLSRMTIDASGNVHVAGNLSKGGGSFKIDHPLDPMNKYLYHSFVESPDMMNVYNGNIVTDKHGAATVVLPEYFDALNRDFRYQLTVIGTFAQAIVAHEIEKNRFVIRTSKPGVKVSWQVTGIRQDAYANAHRIGVEEEKTEAERGRYLHPDAFGVKQQEQNAETAPAADTGVALQSRR